MIRCRRRKEGAACKLKGAVLVVLCFLLIPTAAYANAGPVYMENYPAFSIAPGEDSPIAVEREELTFQMDPQRADEARVTAGYYLKNTSGEHVTVPMVFPFVSEGYSSPGASISLDGEPLDYRLYSGGHVEVRDYLRDPEGFMEQVQMDAILARLNEPRYTAAAFDDTAAAALYEITFGEPLDREVRINFTVDPDKSRALIFGELTGIGGMSGGKCTVSAYVSDYSLGKKGYILVLGEDTLENLEVESYDLLEKRTVIAGEFIRDRIAGTGEPWYLQQRDLEGMYATYVEQVDYFFSIEQHVFSHEMVLENVFYRNNLSVFLFEVEMEPRGSTNLVVTYPLFATIDRSRSSSYINTFAYILNPARNFQEFGHLDIHIELNPSAPYIIESSIPLEEAEQGVYTASLAGLPHEDLVFSTYPKKEVTFIDRTAARIIPPGFEIIFAGLGAAVFLALIAWSLYIKRRRA